MCQKRTAVSPSHVRLCQKATQARLFSGSACACIAWNCAGSHLLIYVNEHMLVYVGRALQVIDWVGGPTWGGCLIFDGVQHVSAFDLFRMLVLLLLSSTMSFSYLWFVPHVVDTACMDEVPKACLHGTMFGCIVSQGALSVRRVPQGEELHTRQGGRQHQGAPQP